MGDQLTIDTGEITTSPGLIPQNYAGREKSPSKPSIRRKNGFFARLWLFLQAYGASLLVSFAIVPIVAAAVFGFAPNLLMKELQANKYVSALQSSETSKTAESSSQQNETS